MLKLDEQDKTSALWKKLVAYYEIRLDQLREKNDVPKSELKTAALRGRIAEIKEFLGIASAAPDQESDDLGIY